MTAEEFEQVAQDAFDALPRELQERVENVHIVVEELPGMEIVRRMRLPSQQSLLGLYEGVPLTRRTTSYGVYPVVPDKITLYRKNITRVAGTDERIRETIRDVLIHEIAHHYGMDEDQVREAGY
jgi:predicted Zn-dependent protease with MMP-like domain